MREGGDYRLVKIAKVYAEYERRLREANALDFDDIILDTVRLLQNFDDVREYYQKNSAMYLLTSTRTPTTSSICWPPPWRGYENICVVGDDDQSIYRFRGPPSRTSSPSSPSTRGRG